MLLSLPLNTNESTQAEFTIGSGHSTCNRRNASLLSYSSASLTDPHRGEYGVWTSCYSNLIQKRTRMQSSGSTHVPPHLPKCVCVCMNSIWSTNAATLTKSLASRGLYAVTLCRRFGAGGSAIGWMV